MARQALPFFGRYISNGPAHRLHAFRMTLPQPRPKKIRLGDLLVEHGMITAEQLQSALALQRKTGDKLGHALIASGLVNESTLLDFLARQLDIPRVDLGSYEHKPEVIERLPESIARRFRVLALEETADHILVGMADPTDIFAHDELSRILGKAVRRAIVSEAELLHILDRVYRRTSELNALADELELEVSTPERGPLLSVSDTTTDAPVVKLIQSLLRDAIQAHASDIHIEPEEKELRIRIRVDGVMRVQAVAERKIAVPLISKLKILAGLDIAEKRLPQDGRFHAQVQSKHIDVRVSTLPQQYGESAVLRVLDQSGELLGLDRIGMPPAMLDRFRRMATSPYGLVLVTGPTGSGKTTTLYGAIKEINDPSHKIITVEDPVEYRLAGVTQVQVNTKIDLSFARVLRSILRQDPDVVLIGEIRDQETMEMALRTAMTGHLVFSTLHTNDAISTILRLVDMGAAPYLLAAATRAILAQRLVRRLCDSCAVPDPNAAVGVDILERHLGASLAGFVFKHGKGCGHCNNSGYQGRIGIYELLEITPELAVALQQGAWDKFNEQAKQTPHFQNLAVSAVQLAAQGRTNLSEVMRITFGMEV